MKKLLPANVLMIRNLKKKFKRKEQTAQASKFTIIGYNSLLEAAIKTVTVSSAFGMLIVSSYLRDIGFGDLFPVALDSTGVLLAIVFTLGNLGLVIALALYLVPAMLFFFKRAAESSSPLLKSKPVISSICAYQLILLATITVFDEIRSGFYLVTMLILAMMCSVATWLIQYRANQWKREKIWEDIWSLSALFITMFFSILPWNLFSPIVGSIPILSEDPISFAGLSISTKYLQEGLMGCWILIFSITTFYIIESVDLESKKDQIASNIKLSLFMTALTFMTLAINVNPSFFKIKIMQLAGLSDGAESTKMISMSQDQYLKIYNPSIAGMPKIQPGTNHVCVYRAFATKKKVVLCPKGVKRPSAEACNLYAEEEFSYEKAENNKCNEDAGVKKDGK